MIYTIDDCRVKMRGSQGKQLDVIVDESSATQQVIASLISIFLRGDFYAMRIHTTNPSFLTFLETTYGFLNGVLWSNDSNKLSPMSRGMQWDSGQKKYASIQNSSGDILYYDEKYTPNIYCTLLGAQEGHNIFLYDPETPWRDLNPLWERYQNEEYIACSFPPDIYDYLLSNEFVFSTARSAHVGSDVFEITVNLYTGCISVMGPTTLQLSSDHLCLYNGLVNTPGNINYIQIGEFNFLESITKAFKIFVFTQSTRHYICIPSWGFVSRVNSLPAGRCPHYTFLGYMKGTPLTMLQYYEEVSQK